MEENLNQVGSILGSQKRLTPIKIVLTMPMPEQRNSLTAKATAVLSLKNFYLFIFGCVGSSFLCEGFL